MGFCFFARVQALLENPGKKQNTLTRSGGKDLFYFAGNPL
jgi:hypothetical protein